MNLTTQDRLNQYEQHALEHLCCYDPRSTSYFGEYAEGTTPRTNCYCDSCFRGKDEMSLMILDLVERVRDYRDAEYEG